MQISSAKENILKKIRQALVDPTPVPFPQSEGNSSVYAPPTQEHEIEFAENFGRISGRFVYCADITELTTQLQQLIAAQSWAQVFCREPELLRILEKPLQGLLIRED